MQARFRIGRVYPRLTCGGAEQDILALLAGIGDTHMISVFVDGEAAQQARALAARYTLLAEPRFERLLHALGECEIVHLHTINDYPLAPLAAVLAGPRLLVQTIHNDHAADACELVDISILVSARTREIVAHPERTQWIPSGIATPELDTERPWKPWFERGEPVRLVEVRRAEKEMAWTLEDLLATGHLDDVELRSQVVGVEGTAPDPRVERLGVQADPTPWIRDADLLLCGSAFESFGRVPLEALALGTRPFVSELPEFQAKLACFADYAPLEVDAAARALRRRLAELPGEAELLAKARVAGRERVQARFSVQRMVESTEAVYAGAGRVERSFGPDDLAEADLALFGRMLDDFSAGRTPRDLARFDELPARARGVLLWAMAHYGWVVAEQAPTLLQESQRLLGEREVIVRDLERLAYGSRGALEASHA